MVSSVWTEPLVEHLRQRWADGASASVIGGELGMTRNAIIGKAHRLKLAGRSGVNPPKPKRMGNKRVDHFNLRKFKAARPPVELPPAPPKPPDCAPVTLLAIRHHGACKYVLGEPNGPDTLMCGAPADGSLCAWHRSLCYYAPDRRPRGQRFAVKRNFDLPEVVTA